MKILSKQVHARRIFSLLSAGIFLLILLTACSGLSLGAKPTATPEPTSTVTNTPEPTATATSTVTNTPEPTATATATPDRTGTAVVKATTTAEAWLEKIQPDLDAYELTLENGHLAYMDPDPVNLEMTEYGMGYFYPIDAGNIADFFIQSDVTWDSSGGLAGCGLVFRADSDVSVGTSYSFMLMRLQFSPAWWISYYENGREQYLVTLNGRAQFSDVIDDSKLGKNRIGLLAQGDQLTVFINGKRFKTVQNNKQLDGDLGYYITQESGKTTCIFTDTVVWQFDQ